QDLFENDQVVAAVRIPADADNVITQSDGQVEHGTMLVMTFEANRFVFVLVGPAMDRLHELRRNSLAAEFRQHAVEPGKVDVRLQLEAKKKADRTVTDAGDQLQDVVTPAEAAAKGVQVSGRAKNLVIKLRYDLQFFRVVLLDDGISH